MGHAWVGGKAVPIESAIAEAARLLGASRLPVIAGLGTDIAGARAAVVLADRLGGVVDHMNSDAVLRDVAVMREAGAFVTTPNEARLRADTLLLVGPGLKQAWPDIEERLLAKPLAFECRGQRQVLWLCPGKDEVRRGAMPTVGRDVRDLPTLLAMLRAHIAGRPAARVSRSVSSLAAMLQAARFGVAAWSARSLDELTIEMLFGLINDLNAKTRFTGLPLASGDNALGVLQVCGWMTGFPMRTAFGRGYPEHDPWRFNAKRLIECGEADCALWISAYRGMTPDWTANIPVISLAAEGEPQPLQQVQIQVGRPALEHDAVEHCATTGTLVARTAGQKGGLPSVAAVIAGIAAALPNAGPWPC